MKKFKSLMAVVALCALSLTFVGCNDDDYIADTLWGVWEGDMQVSVEDYYGNVYYAYETELAFDRDPYEYASGTGYWIDYYHGAPWGYYASHIRWTVTNDRINIYSVEDDTYYYIYDYSLSGNYFTGILESEWGDYIRFRLVKTVAPDWNDFGWGWDYWYDGYYPYSMDYGTRSDGGTQPKMTRKIGRE